MPPDSTDHHDVPVPPTGGQESRRVRQLPPPPPKPKVRPLGPPLVWPDETRLSRWWSYLRRCLSSGWLISFLFHFFLLLGLALLVEASRPASTFLGLTATMTESPPLERLNAAQAQAFLMKPSRVTGNALQLDPEYAVPDVEHPLDLPNSIGRAEGPPAQQPTDASTATDVAVEGALRGRGRAVRSGLALDDGGTPESENAVERGLRWILAHQRDDGSWNFDHHKSYCRGQCANPGTEASTTAATAMALLPFLGAGYTHTQGEHQDPIKRGIYYLVQRTRLTPQGNDLQEGTMYGQGLATIALCEAYAMTGDETLKDYAQGALDFICYAQDRKGGGWRYTPGEPGDTTVTGWQLMGLKSGQMARLSVPSPTIFMVDRFLDSVQSDSGAQYGYLDPRPRQTTTAIGLLCRMYTGWTREHIALQRGVEHLSGWGPSDDNMYYNYYATQVMHHWQGPLWEKWNEKMRDQLIATQAGAGHEAGSWHFSGGRGDVGGRLYNTAAAVMTLEVYYRYMPLYEPRAVESGF